MGGMYELIVPMLYHTCFHTYCEDLIERVEVAEHEIDPPPPHYMYGVCVHS